MDRFVHQTEALGVRATHEQDGDCGDDEVVEAHRDADDDRGLNVDARHRERVAHRGDATQSGAKLGRGATVGADQRLACNGRVGAGVEHHAAESYV